MSLAERVLSVNNDLPIRTDQPVHSGKVRSVYWLTEADSKRLIEQKGYNVAADAPLAIMVISDRISAFDCIWHGEGGMLFGHEKGAYTGAYQSAPGKFEQANGGTLLLDEISEMDLGLQAKLLRVLQEREVERLGGRKSIQLDVRVIATSNRDMRQQVAAGKFREDLYFRLSVLPLQWAPLRDRVDDIIPLAENLLGRHAAKQHRAGVTLDHSACHALRQYPWPGNVRELDNVMQRALILQPGNRITAADLGLSVESVFSEKPSLVDAVAHQTRQLVMGVAASAAEPRLPLVADSEPAAPQLGRDLMKREFEIIADTLRQERGSKKNTAERLGISPRTLRYKLARFREEGLCLDAVSF